MQGRLRSLANRADLGTVTITATELKNYKPRGPVALTTQIRTTFFASLDVLIAFRKSLLLVLIALVPWIALIVLGLFVLYRMHPASLRAHVRLLPPAAPGGSAGTWPAADENPGN